MDAEDVSQGESITPTYTGAAERSTDGRQLRVSFGVELDLGMGNVEVTAVVVFSIRDGLLLQCDSKTVSDFVNDEAIVLLVPFVRETVADITYKTFGNSLFMPLWNEKNSVRFDFDVD